MENKIYMEWKEEFTSRIKKETNSNKQVFTLKDAINKSLNYRNDFDKVMIEYHEFTNGYPLSQNDYFKYVNSYKKGNKLDSNYFKYDLEKLEEYYRKIDEDPNYHFCSISQWENYVLFMLLKFNGLYNESKMDAHFNVKHESGREYNPLTNIPSVLRGVLPESLNLVEYDISRANPTFIDLEIGYEREEDIYNVIQKNQFLKLINSHKDCANINDVRSRLKPVYGDKVNQVITEERFNNKGKIFNDLAHYEEKYIGKFVNENEIENYVRLHDAVYILVDTPIQKVCFDNKVTFNKTIIKPEKVSTRKKTFYKIVNTDNGNRVETSPSMYADFFKQEGFMRITVPGDDRLIVFKNNNKVAKEYNFNSELTSFLRSHINETGKRKQLVENKIAKDSEKIFKQGLKLLEANPFYYYRDKADTFGLPFKNGFFEFKKGNQQPIRKEYKDVNGFFPEHHTQKIEFKYQSDPEISEFERLITMVAVEKDPKYDQLTEKEKEILHKWFCGIGYLAHTQKKHTFSPGIIYSDYGADNISRKGGRGKSLITKAIAKVQKTMVKGGKEFDGGYRHNYADLDESINIYVIDDVPASFNYDNLYTNIVSDISINPKGRHQRTIPFKYAPKFIITTNFAVRYDEDDTSTNRRFIEFKLTDYFNLNNTPEDVFYKQLFDDWDEKEWNRFYNFIYSCVNLFFEEGLEQIEYDKKSDNYRAYFHNEIIETEFQRIFNLLADKGSFTVSDFLSEYNHYDNTLRAQKFFHQNNMKKLINVYLDYHRIDYKYRKDQKKYILNEKACKKEDNDSNELLDEIEF